MRAREPAQTFTVTSPAAASTVIDTNKFVNLWRYERLVIDATITGATGGTLDVYLQRKIAANTWADWVHFPQAAAAAAAKRYAIEIAGDSVAIIEEGTGTDVAANVVLAVNTVINLIPTGDVRIVFVAGASTSAGASQTITITPFSIKN